MGLTLGQKTEMRKAIRPFKKKYQEVAQVYDSKSEAERKKLLAEIDAAEKEMYAVHKKLEPDMDEEEKWEINDQIREAMRIEESEQEEFDFQDGFKPVPKPKNAQVVEDEPEAISCLGDALQNDYKPRQSTMDFGED